MVRKRSPQDAFKEIYYNPETGFGSAKELYRRALQDDTIEGDFELKDAQRWIKNQETEQLFAKTHRDKYSTFILFGATQEYQLDSMFLGKTKYLVIIDGFSRKASIRKLGDKVSTRNSVRAFNEAIEEMGKPYQVYTDRGSEFTGQDFQAFLKSEEIIGLLARTKAWKSERFIGTIRRKLGRAQQIHGKSDITGLLYSLVKSYNSSVHSKLHGRTPNEVHEMGVFPQLVEDQINDRRKVKMKPLKKGDLVRRMKNNSTFKKSSEAIWSSDYFIVDKVRNGRYSLEGSNVFYQRSELQKIVLVETDDQRPEIQLIEPKKKRPDVRDRIGTRAHVKKNK